MAGRKGRPVDDDETNYVSDKDRTFRRLIASGIGLLVIAVVGIFSVAVLGVGNPTPTPTVGVTVTPDDGVGEAADIGRSTVVSSTVQGALGSGGKYKGDWYELYFTAPSYPDIKANHKGSLDQYLSAFIDTAQVSVDMAVYDFDLDNVAEALVRAAGRGARVRFVTDSDTMNNTKNVEVQNALGKLRQANIPIVQDERKPIMHNKFTVVDNKVVATGSWNYTDGDTYHLNNNLIFIKLPQIAQNYTAEFEKMFVAKQFGAKKPAGVPNPQVTTNTGVLIENYFAPEDGVAKRIVGKINGAQSSIYFLAFSFTQDNIGNAIMAKVKNGLRVGGVFETTGSNTPFSEYGKMAKAGLEVYTDGNPWVMHHKVIIIDERIVIFGSFNFSDNADKENDENLLIVDDENLARAFKTEYDRVLAVAKAKMKK